jgi:5-methylcytosine-specific restriction protein A
MMQGFAMFNDIFGHFNQQKLTAKQLAFGHELFDQAGIAPDDPCLVFTARRDGLRPISYALWWVFQPFADGALGLLVDSETAERYSAAHPERRRSSKFAYDLGEWIYIPKCDPDDLQEYVRNGARTALSSLRARHYKGAPHARYNNIAYRNIFFREADASPALLLTWNPKEWDWEELKEDCENVYSGRDVVLNWRTSNRKDVFVGMRFYLLKQGAPPQGIMASGVTIALPEPTDYEKRNGEPSYTVKIVIQHIIDPDMHDVLPRAQIKDNPVLAAVHWDTQASGIRIPAHIASQLEVLWHEHLHFEVGPSELPPDEKRYYEGAKRQPTVDRYERSGRARQDAIDIHGTQCCCCDLEFVEMYGDIGAGFIHIHHIDPLGNDEERRVNPKTDLVPVCPNCHAMLHRHADTPRTVEELRYIISKCRSTTTHRS